MANATTTQPANTEFNVNIDTTVAAKVTRKMATIFIDEEKGKPNFEVVGVNGKMFQIRRGVDVEVPEEVLHVLKNAVGTRYVKRTNDKTGLEELVPQQFNTVPFRVIG